MKQKCKVLIGLGILIVLAYLSALSPKKQAFSDISNTPCKIDADCPCFKSSSGIYGVGVSKCEAGKCDPTFCIDIQPVGQWAKDQPWQFLKSNPILLILLILVPIVYIFWPKG